MGGWSRSVLVQNDYTYDAAGQRSTNQISDSSGPIRMKSYGYDALNRLASVNYGDGETQSYAFDACSNLNFDHMPASTTTNAS